MDKPPFGRGYRAGQGCLTWLLGAAGLLLGLAAGLGAYALFGVAGALAAAAFGGALILLVRWAS
jgi:hypothetical protein